MRQKIRFFATKWFARFARQEQLDDLSLTEACARAEEGLIDADLGGGLIKQRVARRGGGRSGGYRTILAYRRGKRAVFLYGFAKNARENIAPDDHDALRRLGQIWLSADERQIERALLDGALREVTHEEQN